MAAALADVRPPAGLRRAGEADLDAMYALHSAHDRHYTGRVRQTREEVRLDIVRPGHAHWIRPAGNGGADLWVGAAAVPHIEHNVGWVMVLPETVDDEFGRELVVFAARAAARLNPQQDVHLNAGARESQLTDWVTAAGGVETRRFGRMEIELDPTGAHAGAPELPAGVTLRTATDTDADWHTLYDVVEIAFRDHYGHRPTSYDEFVADARPEISDYSLVWIASVEGHPAAALLGFEKPSEGYVGTLGTLREFRSRGLGRLLLRTAFAEFARRGHDLSTLHVDLSNPTGAVHVYESAGMHLADYEIDYRFPALSEPGGQPG